MLATRFARLSPILRSTTPLAEDQIRAVAPSIFAEDKAPTRSERYTYIPTIQVLRGLAREGFRPFMVTQARARDAMNQEHTKHMVRLRRTGDAEPSGSDTANEIILINSHNGASCYQMLAGAFRFVCSNGLVAGHIEEDIRLPHRGDIVDNVIDGAFRVVEGFEKIDASREAMRDTALSAPQQEAFARAAIALRFDAQADAPAPVTERQVLAPRRAADTAVDLWTTFNRIQENTLRGGLYARTATGRRVRTRPVEGVDRSVALNRALWVLAEEMRRLAA